MITFQSRKILPHSLINCWGVLRSKFMYLSSICFLSEHLCSLPPLSNTKWGKIFWKTGVRPLSSFTNLENNSVAAVLKGFWWPHIWIKIFKAYLSFNFSTICSFWLQLNCNLNLNYRLWHNYWTFQHLMFGCHGNSSQRSMFFVSFIIVCPCTSNSFFS